MILKAEARDIVRRLVRDRIAPKATPQTLGAVCKDVASGLPEGLTRELAAAYLADVHLGEAREFRPTRPYTRRKAEPLTPENQAQLDAELNLIERRMWDSIDKSVDQFKTAVRAEITAELLSSTFALTDGTTVTWGEANSEQHRMASLEHQANAVEQVHQAALHEAALDMLRQSGSPCLAKCEGVAA